MISAMARNSVNSRRFGSALEPFSAAEWLFEDRPGSELASLREASVRRSFEGLRKDFGRLSIASAMNEIALKVAPPGQHCEELFLLHSNALAALEELPEGGADLALLNIYLLKLFRWYGSQPPIEACLRCGLTLAGALEKNPGQKSVDGIIADSGWLCPECGPAPTSDGPPVQVPLEALADLMATAALPMRQAPRAARASRHAHERLLKYLERLLAYHVPGFDRAALKSLRFVTRES